MGLGGNPEIIWLPQALDNFRACMAPSSLLGALCFLNATPPTHAEGTQVGGLRLVEKGVNHQT